jgi:two-component system LytT family response regulator
MALLAEYREAGESPPIEAAEPAAPFAHRLAVRTSGRIYFLRTEEIDWIEAADYYVKLHVGPKSHLMRESMNKLEKQLDPEMFLRVHRSSIVNLDRVKELHAGGGADPAVVLQDGTRLKLSRSRRERLNRLLDRR